MSFIEPGPGGLGKGGSKGNGGRVPLPPQMAMRVAIMGVVAFGLFAIIFFRLWYLQVLSGEQYLRQAQVNKVRTEPIPAPRGKILDRTGEALVANEQATVIAIDPRALPDAEKELAAQWGKDFARRERTIDRLTKQREQEVARQRLLRSQAKTKKARKAKVDVPKIKKPPKVRIPAIPASLTKRFADLGEVIGMRPETIQSRVILGLWLAPYAPVKIKTGVNDTIRDYLYERPERFPGVEPSQTYVRTYKYKDLAAQLFGTLGGISEAELASGAYKGAGNSTVVGKSGLEKQYDSELRGRDGVERFLVDAQGDRQGAARQTPPSAGRSLKLTLDRNLQAVGQGALQTFGGGRPGAFVAMNPENGAVYALGSAPSFDANILAKPITTERYDAIFSEEAGAPQFNRAITGGYPTGSTFKPITALAALQHDPPLLTTSEVIASPPCITIAKQPFCNAGKEDLGAGNIVESMKVSADVFFYVLGQRANNEKGQVIQSMARKLGLGHTTGIDVPGEFGGTIPDRKWRAELNKKETAWEKRTGNPCCLYSDGRGWSVGDNVQVAVGQGDVQASPLQMAVMYSTIANGGRVVVPHLGMEVLDNAGRLLRKIPSVAAKRVHIESQYRQAIMEGLHEAASAPGGTSTSVFTKWPQNRLPVYGKTGTAERLGRPRDQSWYVAYVPGIKGDPNARPIVIAATIEDGGFGAEAAAPAVCTMLKSFYNVQEAPCTPGESKTN